MLYRAGQRGIGHTDQVGGRGEQRCRQGRFHIDRIPPGDYRAFAWEDVNDGAWQDPEFMSVNENRGTPVRIAEGTTGTVRLTLIARQ